MATKDTFKQAKLTASPTPPTDLLRLKQAAAYLNFSLPTLWRLEQRDPSFPKKIRMGARLCYFRKSDIDDWLQSREA